MPCYRKRFIDARIAVQDKGYQLDGMVASGSPPPCGYLRLPSFPFGYYGRIEFLKP
jgi:hypothetical protein